VSGPEIRQAGKGPLGLSTLQSRRKRAVGRQWKQQQARWVDPYPWIMGTFPEKLIFAWLADRGIQFTFQAEFPDYPGTLTVESYRPDFLIEWAKVIIEVQGQYFHSLPGAPEHDALKAAVYEMSGYTPYAFWEDDILTDLGTLMGGIKELGRTPKLGKYEWTQQIDDLKGLRAMNAASRLAPLRKLKSRSRRARR